MGNCISSVSSSINGSILLKAAAVDFSIQWIAFAIAYVMKTEKFYDLVGSSTFLYLAWVTLTWSKRGTTVPFFQRQILQNSCITLWAARLGTFLFSRVLRSGEDRRFRKAKQNPWIFFTFWTVQGFWVWTTLLPTMIMNMKDKDKRLNYRDYIGFSLFVSGFLIEAIADHQKSRFRDNPKNHGAFISHGLWSICRHPNYLGEIMLWLGLFLPASNVLEGKELLSVLSPLFVVYLLTNVSGVPLLERYADKKWGNLVEYQQYKVKTAKIFPYIW